MSQMWRWSLRISILISGMAILLAVGLALSSGTVDQPQTAMKKARPSLLNWPWLSKWSQAGLPEVQQLKTRYAQVYYQPPVIKGKTKLPSHFSISLVSNRPAGWVPLSEISVGAVGAVVVSEDWSFFQHPGYDARMIREAIIEDFEEGQFSRGASTLTQQVVKNVFLSQEKTILRKIKELVLAVQLEKTVGKRRILETYLNVVEWGEGVFGIRQAAQHYFSKAPRELTPKEGAFLAMLLPSPKRYSQSFRRGELTPYARRTVEQILAKMVKARYLSEEESRASSQSALSFEKNFRQVPSTSVLTLKNDQMVDAIDTVQ